MRLPFHLCIAALAVMSGLGIASPVSGKKGASTPYDGYMEPVRSVLADLDKKPVTLERVRSLMLQGWGFRYVYTDPYLPKAPAVTALEKAGDCKDKSLWLASRIGDPTIHYVIGKARKDSAISHAWLYWRDARGRWWILDCANRKEPLRVDRTGPDEYIPMYSYTKSGTFRYAAAESGFATGPVAASR